MRKALAAIILSSAAALAACGSSPAPTPRGPATAAAPAPQSEPQPPRQSATGVGLTLLTVDDKGSRVARSLAPFDTDPPQGVFDETERAGWRSWGFRWIAVPMDTLDAALGTQRPTRAIETRDMGTFPRWQPLIRVGEIGGVAVRSPGAVTRLLSGRPRLLARAWRTPVIEDGTRRNTLRLDLALQLEIKPESERDPLTPVRATSEYARGELLGPGLMSVTMRADHALVLVGVSPETEWAVADDGTGVAFKDTESIGPDALRGRSLGEVMLSRSGSNPRKVLIVLTPKAGDP